jgi:hypothetical protein
MTKFSPTLDTYSGASIIRKEFTIGLAHSLWEDPDNRIVSWATQTKLARYASFADVGYDEHRLFVP